MVTIFYMHPPPPSPKKHSFTSPHAGPKDLRAESARAVTGRQCPHKGEGEDFLTRQLGFFYENF